MQQSTQSTLELTRQTKSTLVLANAGELISGIIKEIAGNDISNSINGSIATTEMIQMIGHQRLLKSAATKA